MARFGANKWDCGGGHYNRSTLLVSSPLLGSYHQIKEEIS